MIVRAVWNEGRRFVAEADGLSPISMSWGEDRTDFSPMELLLASLAGCTGIDVVDILGRMREKVTRVEVKVDAERREQHPKYWHVIDVKYEIYGDGVSEEKAGRAVTLSVEKYCSVSAMFRPEIVLRHSFSLHRA